jgi:fucose permease
MDAQAQVVAVASVMTLGAALHHVSANWRSSAWMPRGQAIQLDLAYGFFFAGAAAGPWMYAFVVQLKGAESAVAAWNATYWAAAAVFGVNAVIALRFHALPAKGVTILHRRSAGPAAFFSATGVFCAVGLELTTACFLVSFLMQPDVGGLDARAAAAYFPLYWAGLNSGRLAGVALLTGIPAGRLVGIVAVSACLLLTAAIASTGALAMCSLILAGAAGSISFPGVYALAAPGILQAAGGASGLLLSTIAGGAIVPFVQCAVADHIGVHASLVIPTVCCLYLMFFGFMAPELWAGRQTWPERRKAVCRIDSQRP